MHKNTKLRLGAVASLAIAAIAFGALPAQADPTTPPFPTLAGAGSDTTQDVVGGLTTLAPTVVGSWNAVGSATIQTKSGGPAFQRPNGSGDGVYALSMSAGAGTGLYNSVNIAGQLDYARSSSGPSSSYVGSDLTYIPFAIDAVTSIAIHPVTGDVYVAGFSNSSTFPGTVGGAQENLAGAYKDRKYDFFIARLNSSLTTLIQSTYLGGNAYESGVTIAIDPVSGDVYVAGQTSSRDLPGTSGGAQAVLADGNDVYIARLNASLTTLIQATYLGGRQDELSAHIARYGMKGDVRT